jgi:hypothetical protein
MGIPGVNYLLHYNVEKDISEFLNSHPELRAPEKENSQGDDSKKATQKAFYINFTTQELILPESTKDHLPAYLMTVKLFLELFPEGKLYTTKDDRPTGLSESDLTTVVSSISEAIGLFKDQGGKSEINFTKSMLGRLYLQYITLRYKGRFVNLLRTEKLPNLEQFMKQISLQPVMRGREQTLSYSYFQLWFQLLSRLMSFDEKESKFSRQICQSFYENYIRADITKETLQEALKENRIKMINLNTFNPVLFDHESDSIDMLGITTPAKYEVFFARTKARYDKGDYLVCKEVHHYNQEIRKHPG